MLTFIAGTIICIRLLPGMWSNASHSDFAKTTFSRNADLTFRGAIEGVLLQVLENR